MNTPMPKIEGKGKHPSKANKPAKKVDLGTRKESMLDKKYAHIQPVHENHVFETQTNSIREYLNQSHPDVKKLIEQSTIKQITAKTHEIEVVTSDKLRITIATISKNERSIKIVQKKKQIFYGKSKLSFKEVVN